MSIIKNVRRGFATNSSSSHSFVYLKKPSTDTSGYGDDAEFGWGDFRLDSILEKLFYVLVDRISSTWPRIDPAEAYKQYASDFPEFTEEDFENAADGYVDHQSQDLLLLDEARDPYVAVFGGNDNGGGSRERAHAIAQGEVDWTKTSPSYSDDLTNIPDEDKYLILQSLIGARWIDLTIANADSDPVVVKFFADHPDADPETFHFDSPGYY